MHDALLSVYTLTLQSSSSTAFHVQPVTTHDIATLATSLRGLLAASSGRTFRG